MRAPKHEVAGVWWRVGVPARMDGARTFSYMIECQSWGEDQTSTQEVPASVNSLNRAEEREMPAAFVHMSHPLEWPEEAGRTDGERKGRMLRCDFSPGKLSRPAADPLGTVLCAFTMNILKRPLVEFFCYFAVSTDVVL